METQPKSELQILVADDQADVRQALKLALGRAGFRVQLVPDPGGAEAAVRSGGVDLALVDLNYTRDTTSGREGLALIESLRALEPELPVVAMTAWGSVDLAVAALKSGAVDFVEKPWDNTRLVTVVRTQLEAVRVRAETRRYRTISRIQLEDRGQLVGESVAFLKMLEMVERVAASDATVLITGENGVGKGLVAEHLHRRSRRANGPFVSVNMGAIPESLFESEMFGHVRGAFTDAREARTGRFELADGGSLFLDEIGNLAEAHQAKLLRVLECGQFEPVGASHTRSVDVRVIAATNAALFAEVESGRFRRDLYYRLNTIEIRIPPLRERVGDVRILAEHFLSDHSRRHARPVRISAAGLDALENHHWPGNVRELSHAIERAVLLCPNDLIEPEHLQLSASAAGVLAAGRVMPLEQAEALLIRNALERYQGNARQAAAALGISRSAMYRRMEKFGIKGGI